MRDERQSWHACSCVIGTKLEDPRAVRFGPDGEVVIVGHFDGTLDLGAGPLNAASGWDMFIHRGAP